MGRLIILIAILAAGLIIWSKFNESDEQERKKLIMNTITWGVIGGLVLLGISGHLSGIEAIIGGAIAMLSRLPSVLKYLPALERLFARDQNSGNSNQQTGGNQRAQTNNSSMSKEEALDIFGLKPGATREEILQAHKRMMQKVHPDRGGSDYLAAQLNRAKEALLG